MPADSDGHIVPMRMNNIAAGGVWLVYGQIKSLFLWVPVFLSIGIGCYFSFQTEPPLWIAYVLGTLIVACFSLAYFKRKEAINADGHGLVHIMLLAVGFVCLGLFAGQVRTFQVSGPVIEKVVVTKHLRGIVEQRDITRRGFARLTIKPLSIKGLDATHMPRRIVLVSYKINIVDILPGQLIEASARFEPSYRPTHPGGYDPARRDYFMSIGARGRLLGEVKIISAHMSGRGTFIEKFRQDLSQHIRSEIDAHAGRELSWHMGPFATALLTGQRSLIDPELTNALRASGLAHILAISGLHMVLLTGTLFFVTRMMLSFSSRLALTHPIKKYASFIAILGGVFYLLISGAPISAQRAFIMVAIAFVAVIFDRRAISLHNLALAATIILLLRPESLTSISFQMSFASVTGLVAFYEFYQSRPGLRLEQFGMWRGPALFFSSIFLTTLVASLATMPFVAHYFGSIPSYGLLANMLVMPIFSLMTMPLALLALFLTPLGVSGFAFELMGYSLKLISNVAQYVSGLPGAVMIVPHIAFAGMLWLVIAGLWFLLWRKPVSWFCVLPLFVAISFVLSNHKPDVLISERGRLIGVKSSPYQISLSDKGSNYVAQRWLQYYGDGRSIKSARADDRINCDQAGCIADIYDHEGQVHKIALIRDRAILQEECGRSDILVIAIPVRVLPKMCSGPELIISRLDLWRSGSHALYLDRHGKWQVQTTAAQQGVRPWNREWVYQQKRN